MFKDRLWPEGFEFPACVDCNSGSSNDDLLVALLARFDPITGRSNDDGKLDGLMKRVRAQHPDLFERMMPTAREARERNKQLGLLPKSGHTHQEAGVLKLTSELKFAVCVLARKLAKGVFYNDVKIPFPEHGCLILNWFTNADLIRDKTYTAFDGLKNIVGAVPVLRRSSRLLNDQFEYKFSLANEKNVFILQARFGFSFGLVVFGSAIRGHLEKGIAELRETTNHDGPFEILQSSDLSTFADVLEIDSPQADDNNESSKGHAA
jgi:hypothetical protein